MKWLWLLLASLALTACDYDEVKREIGYKGKARVNPWLAAERFCAPYEGDVRSLATWTPPTFEDAVWVVPAGILGNESFTRQMESWIDGGGHLIVLVDHANAETNDWSPPSATLAPDPALLGMLERAGIRLEHPESARDNAKATKIKFQGKSFDVDATSDSAVSLRGGKPRVFVSVEQGDGRLTVLTDGRLFRNRWLGEKDHAGLLDALVRSTGHEGNIGFTRGSALTLWKLLGDHLWPVLAGLGVLTLLWLWKNFSRFGPLEAAGTPHALRGYDHHLEALGDFQWRLDRATALLAPLRAQVVERGQRMSHRHGRRDEDFFQFLADFAGLPRERVFRALAESAPADSAVLTRTTADLQRLLQVLH
jgi:hypothetical protein